MRAALAMPILHSASSVGFEAERMEWTIFSSCSAFGGGADLNEQAVPQKQATAGEERALHKHLTTRQSRPNLYTYLSGSPVNHGTFGSSSTVAEVLQLHSARGRCFYITGAYSEVGLALTEELVLQGATVLMGYRHGQEGCKATAAGLTARAAAVGGHAVPVLCDISSLKAVQEAAASVQATGLPVHVVVHCASHCSSEFQITPDGLESHFAVNYLNPLLLTLLLLPLLDRSCSTSGQDSNTEGLQRNENSSSCIPRVVWSTCSAHHISYTPARSSSGCRLAWKVRGRDAAAAFMPAQAYGQSKLAVVMAARQLAERAAAAGMRLAVFAAHPGITQQGLTKYAGYQEGSWFHGLKALLATGLAGMGLLKSSQQAAATLAYAALSPDLLLSDAELKSMATSLGPELWAGRLTAGQQPQQPATHTCCCSADSSQQHVPLEPATPCKGCGCQGASMRACSATATGQQQVDEKAMRACWYAYCEDCSVSAPSIQARSREDGAALWQLSETLLMAHLGPYHSCSLLPKPYLEEPNYSPFKQQHQLVL